MLITHSVRIESEFRSELRSRISLPLSTTFPRATGYPLTAPHRFGTKAAQECGRDHIAAPMRRRFCHIRSEPLNSERGTIHWSWRKSTLSGNILTLPAKTKKELPVMPSPYPPNERPDAVPLHENAIRRFREELRMDRQQFADLVEANIDTLRVWEAGKSLPRAPAALKIIQIASRNDYPLAITDIFPT